MKGASTAADGAKQRLLVHIELLDQGVDKTPYVRLLDSSHDVDVDGRARLTGNGAGNRPADAREDPQRVEHACDAKRDSDRIELDAHDRSSWSISG
jgi:hypothetical protein